MADSSKTRHERFVGRFCGERGKELGQLSLVTSIARFQHWYYQRARIRKSHTPYIVFPIPVTFHRPLVFSCLAAQLVVVPSDGRAENDICRCSETESRVALYCFLPWYSDPSSGAFSSTES